MENKLPESVRELAAVIGIERALYLIERLPQCGKRPWRRVLYIPKRMPADHKLVEILGWHDARRLQRVFAGEILQVATCKAVERENQFKRIELLHRSGVTTRAIAKREKVTPQYVNWILRKVRKSRQRNPQHEPA